ncbi:hypothetical protein NDU88_007309 [Pleurodeles waltl]|uniref:Uncharacterized protein n=1 Tax=Pleurodeles waltl TaxID=8319 RepID=A0AAV7LRQ4_PLEWA|nr:hypothetical protein NDU88_007309 [Pleurodeles waltl]
MAEARFKYPNCAGAHVTSCVTAPTGAEWELRFEWENKSTTREQRRPVRMRAAGMTQRVRTSLPRAESETATSLWGLSSQSAVT